MWMTLVTLFALFGIILPWGLIFYIFSLSPLPWEVHFKPPDLEALNDASGSEPEPPVIDSSAQNEIQNQS